MKNKLINTRTILVDTGNVTFAMLIKDNEVPVVERLVAGLNRNGIKVDVHEENSSS